jgi:hypothetical protein
MMCQVPLQDVSKKVDNRHIKAHDKSIHLSKLGFRMTHEQETRRGVALYETNPFMTVVQTKTRRITNKRGNMMLVNSDTGEISAPIAGFWEAEEVDSSRFIKLFVNGVKALAELTNPGTRVFELLYIEMQNQIGKDQVYLSYTGLDKNEKNISRSTFSRGLSELIEKKFIAAMPAVGWYWLNPDFVFNGDRLAFVKEYRKTPRKPREKDTLTADLFSDQATGQIAGA